MSNALTKRPLLKRLTLIFGITKVSRSIVYLRFIAAGAVNALFGYTVFAGLLLAGLGAGASLVVATLAGVLFNFQTSRHFVFRTTGRAVRFIAVYAAILALNWLALRELEALGVSVLVAQALVTIPVATLSFLGQRLFVFTERESSP